MHQRLATGRFACLEQPIALRDDSFAAGDEITLDEEPEHFELARTLAEIFDPHVVAKRIRMDRRLQKRCSVLLHAGSVMDRLTLMDIGFPRQAIHAEHGKDRLTRFFVRTKQDYKVARLRPEQGFGNKFGDSVNVIHQSAVDVQFRFDVAEGRGVSESPALTNDDVDRFAAVGAHDQVTGDASHNLAGYFHFFLDALSCSGKSRNAATVYLSRAHRVRLLQTAHQMDMGRKMQSQPNSSAHVMQRVACDNALLAACDRTHAHDLARSSDVRRYRLRLVPVSCDPAR